MFLPYLISSEIRRSSDSLPTDACNEAILECYCTILFLSKDDGLVMVRRPMQFVSLSIHVGQMFAMKQLWNVIVRSYSFLNTTV